ncbi:c-type cytochrome [Ideonella livida]|uniref:Cytochrome c4 n=1 Tax=Ideonella livida TaxID=2707176 RepID=A0A7C9TLL7_9BURK|nr:c-type cytochrome [Ideonella livida]NDY92564.1 cytochrome c4 [Ideonella livida]
MPSRLIPWLLATAALTALTPAGAAGNAEAGKTKAAVCMGCHGPDGNSPADMWPKIAGQLQVYLVRQLHDFKAGRRVNEQMSPMAAPLGDQDIEDLAAFFATQKVSKVENLKPELVAAGRQIYLKGKGRPAVVPACLGCHAPAGQGKADWSATMKAPPTTLAPAIGGQHPAYLVRQLTAYRDGTRANDAAHVMRDVASRLTDADIAAVAEYAASLAR